MKTLLAISLMQFIAVSVFYIHAEDRTSDIEPDIGTTTFKITVTEHDGAYTPDEFLIDIHQLNEIHEMMLEWNEIREALDLGSFPKNPNEKFTKAVTKHVFVAAEDSKHLRERYLAEGQSEVDVDRYLELTDKLTKGIEDPDEMLEYLELAVKFHPTEHNLKHLEKYKKVIVSTSKKPFLPSVRFPAEYSNGISIRVSIPASDYDRIIEMLQSAKAMGKESVEIAIPATVVPVTE